MYASSEPRTRLAELRSGPAIVSMKAHSGKVKNTTIGLSTPCPKAKRGRR